MHLPAGWISKGDAGQPADGEMMGKRLRVIDILGKRYYSIDRQMKGSSETFRI